MKGLLSLLLPIGRMLALGLAVTSQLPDRARAQTIDEYQIAWMIPPASSERQTVRAAPQGTLFSTKLLPEKVFLTKSRVVAKNGDFLMPNGTRLALMDYPRLLACNLERGPEGSVARSNRICVLDEDGDLRFDTYFLRSFGKSMMTTDGLWFAMNGKMPKKRIGLAAFDHEEGDRTAMAVSPELTVRYARIFDKSQATLLVASVAGRLSATSVCNAYLPRDDAASGFRVQRCLVPGFDVAVLGREGESLTFSVAGQQRPVRVRFTASYGLLMGHDITGMTLTYADAR